MASRKPAPLDGGPSSTEGSCQTPGSVPTGSRLLLHEKEYSRVFWQTPTDIVAEARHYELITEHTQGEHTALLEKHQKPLEALQMRLTNKEKQES